MSRAAGFPTASRVVCRSGDAFTLLELLIAFAIVAVLLAIGLGTVRGAKQRAATARARAEMAVLAAALEQFKRVHGDYPQTGPSAPGTQRIASTNGPGHASAPAVLFNALAGVYGPSGPGDHTRASAPLVEFAKFTLERPLETNGLPANTAFVDPWGQRYLYFYRSAASGDAWQAPSYVLFSAGPDGTVDASPDASGRFPAGSQFAGANADNVYADSSL